MRPGGPRRAPERAPARDRSHPARDDPRRRRRRGPARAMPAGGTRARPGGSCRPDRACSIGGRPARRRRVLIATAAACDDAGLADDVTVPPTLAVGTLPGAPEPTPPAPTPVPTVPEPTPASFVPGALASPPRPGGRGCCVGTGRATAGEPARMAAYASSGRHDVVRARRGRAPITRRRRPPSPCPTGAVLVAGSIDAGDGERPGPVAVCRGRRARGAPARRRSGRHACRRRRRWRHAAPARRHAARAGGRGPGPRRAPP